MRLEPLDVFLEQFVLGARVGPVHVTGRRALFVRPEDEAVVFLAQVPGAVRLAQHAQLGQAFPLALL